jgi:hypothetical protein
MLQNGYGDSGPRMVTLRNMLKPNAFGVPTCVRRN